MNPNVMVRAALANLGTTELLGISVSLEDALRGMEKCMAKGNYGRFEEADWLAALARVNELKCDVEDILASRRRIGRSS